VKFAGAVLITVGILGIMFTVRKPPGAVGQTGSIPDPTSVGQTIVNANPNKT